MTRKLALGGSVLVLLVTSSVAMAVPSLMTYQGALTDAAGKPADGTYSMTFEMYSARTGGAPVWSEPMASVKVTNGVFTVLLGATSALPAGLTGCNWIQVTVDGTPMLPRQRLSSVPYALEAGDAARLNGQTSSYYQNARNLTTGTLRVARLPQVPTGKLASNAVTSAKIKNRTILGGDLALGAVAGGAGGVLADGTVTANDLADGAVTAAKIQVPFDVTSSVDHLAVVRGENSSTTGVGLEGVASAANGVTFGVLGETSTSNDLGTGVYGYASGTTGATRGVYGQTVSTSDDATGVYGYASGGSGVTRGVYGETRSTTAGAAGLYGVASATSGITCGVYGETQSTSSNASGLYGYAVGTEGTTHGVFGETRSTTSGAAGLYGLASGASGDTRGVYGQTTSTSSGAAGLYGFASGTSGVTNGVYAQTNSTTYSAAGVEGYAAGASGVTSGVSGRTASTTGGAAGVKGEASGTSGTIYGVDASVMSADGCALHAWCSDANAYGLYIEQGKAYFAGYATFAGGHGDLAENYKADGVEAGDVVVIGEDGRLVKCTQERDTRVAGIVSTQPSMKLNGRLAEGKGVAPLALVGRVTCKVDATRAPIKPGDLLVTSATPGHAMKCTSRRPAAGTVLGKALEGLERGTGVIHVLVTLR
jgi:hypothetical protein